MTLITMGKQIANLPITHKDDEALLRLPVAVIENARQEVAKHINGYVSTAYWEIGQLLHERKSCHGDGVDVELALEDMGKPIGVADYQLIVPKKCRKCLLTR